MILTITLLKGRGEAQSSPIGSHSKTWSCHHLRPTTSSQGAITTAAFKIIHTLVLMYSESTWKESRKYLKALTVNLVAMKKVWKMLTPYAKSMCHYYWSVVQVWWQINSATARTKHWRWSHVTPRRSSKLTIFWSKCARLLLREKKLTPTTTRSLENS